MADANTPKRPPAQLLDPLPIAADRAQLLRYLGYRGSAASRRALPAVIESQLGEGEPLLRPRGVYSVCSIDHKTASTLRLGGVEIRGQVASFLSAAERIVAFVVTVGREITESSRAKSAEGDIVAAWALDALGSFAAEAAAEALSAHLRARLLPSESLSARYSPGYCGMKLTEQKAVFGLLEADRVGVSLLPSMLMQPTKSVSGLLGLGPLDAFATYRSACDRCELWNCSMRRHSETDAREPQEAGRAPRPTQ